VFKDILKSTVEGLPGALGAIFADWEGESVEHFFAGPEDEIKLLGAHQGILLNLVKEAAAGAGHGAVKCMMLTTDKARVVVQPIKDGYFLVLLLTRHCNSGLALRAASSAAGVLSGEI